MTDGTGGRECCPHASDIQRDLAGAISIAEQLVGLLLAQAGTVSARSRLRLVGSPEASAPEHLAKVITFPARRARSRLA